MIQKKHFSIHHDFKTGMLYRLCLSVGIFLLAVLLIIKATEIFLSYHNYPPGVTGVIIAFIIIFLGIGIILYFIHYQFMQLEKIADELDDELEKKESMPSEK
ncbi:MAG TPA: hypothetical protein ENI51_01470 [Candidatus Atribacteria bacterium]|nr:hypothetical protein [Candidatus Atribacteria bacterium]